MRKLQAASVLLSVLSLLAGCMALGRTLDRKVSGTNPYEKPPFYARYLHPENHQDRQIQLDIDALRQNPRSATLHNELGMLLAAKGFPKDAEMEFVRSVHSDSNFYPAWYNLGLIREARGNHAGAEHAFRRTLDLKPGHSSALFEMGLVEEKKGHTRRAIAYYQKAYGINHSLLDVHYNPRVLDSRLVDASLIHLYPSAHERRSLQFSPTPGDARGRMQEAPSPQAPASNIVTPSAPVTEPATQTPPPSESGEAMAAPPSTTVRTPSADNPGAGLYSAPAAPAQSGGGSPTAAPAVPMQSVPSLPPIPDGNRRRRRPPPVDNGTPPPPPAP